MLKILQARLQQYVNQELPDVQAGFRKGRGTRDQIVNTCWIIEKAREFQKSIYFSISPSNEYSGLISFRLEWFDLSVQGTLKSFLQHHNSKASILWCSAFLMVQLSHLYIIITDFCRQSDVSAFKSAV